MANTVSAPNISDPNASLEALSMRALRRFGDGVPSSVDEETILMFLEFGNLIIEEWNAHPYWSDYKIKMEKEETPVQDVDYYTHHSEHRPIPDDVVVNGLLYHYAAQQLSQKASVYMPLYARTMSQRLWGMTNGHGRPIMNIVDGGSRGGRS